ncbi:hypothetical protein K5M73_02005 [Streptomonospora halotolerans]|nr:DUF6879 family protein [Streptomonospora nanhaiensis]MBX9387019.1 hypothetical protein [Streptomonospora nanhaiensis]
MFDEFEHTAFRLETLQNYAVEYEDELFARFLTAEREGLPAPLSDDDWQQEVRDGTAAGRSYSRVHVVIEPLTDYVRFECASGYRSNIAAGEDVRILPARDGRWPAGIPRMDYWLFDSRRLLVMDYAESGALTSMRLVTDSKAVESANAWRDRALDLSLPFAEYAKRFDEYMRPL